METLGVQISSRLAPFVGNDPVCESEHGGYIKYDGKFAGVRYLEPVSEHQKLLQDYALQVQKAVGLHGTD